MLDAKLATFQIGSKTLISDVSLSFAPGKLYLVIGPNGAGKSTLIKVLAGLLRPQTGSIEYEGIDVRMINVAELAKRRAVLSQAVEIAFPLTVREVVMMGRSPHFGSRPGGSDEVIANELMKFFDVLEFGDRNYQTLSGGERQRVNFARVLAQLWTSGKEGAGRPRDECRYLFLDEPLTFLDIRHQIEFMKKVKTFAHSADVVTIGVVHDLNLAARFADEIIAMSDGRVVAAGPPSELLTAELLREVFGVEPRFVPMEPSGVHMIFE